MSHTRVALAPEEQEELNSCFSTNFPADRLSPGNWLVSPRLDLSEIKNLQVYEDDIWIVTPPKCGTTWMQELIWLICHDVDLETTKKNQFYRFPFLELGSTIPPDILVRERDALLKATGLTSLEDYPPEDVPQNEDTLRSFMYHSLEYVKRMPRPRFVKSHLAPSVLPEGLVDKCKVVFVGRNIKDAALSFYYHMRLCGFHRGFPEFASLFRRNLVLFNPLIPLLLEGFKLRDHPNVFFTTYEEMSRDLKPVAQRLIKFLGKDESKIDLDKLLSAVHIDSFRNNKFVNKEKEVPPDTNGNGFIRKGRVGDWKNHFTDEMNKEWDPWIEEQLKGTGYVMEFEL